MSTAISSQLSLLPDGQNGLPLLAGWEPEIKAAMASDQPVFAGGGRRRLEEVSAGFAIALHMHQPTVPAGAQGELISYLQYMFEHPYEGDNHNAGPFAYCYARLGDFIPDLVSQGCDPRVMLDYSGTLLWGFQQMQRHDILEKLRIITCNPTYQPHVEWLGTFWGHAVIPSTPIPDFKLQIRAWQHHFASLFGLDALSRVRGFSPPEMHLPNHPDTLYSLLAALLECGYRWLLVQEHTVESMAGGAIDQPHLPHRLVARNSQGQVLSMSVLIKTQGSDTKLVGQMQPYAEAQTLSPEELAGQRIPPLVTQISDGENGGVMMNEFPSAFKRTWHELSHTKGSTVGFCGSEYLEMVQASGISPADFVPCQPRGQHMLWATVGDNPTPQAVSQAIATLRQKQGLQMEGASWTNDRSWVDGYENVLDPMQRLSARFHQVAEAATDEGVSKRQIRYQKALLHNLLLQTSCFRYWGQGVWTDYAQEIFRRGEAIMSHDF
ncbi:glycosyl hydrolase family 57 [filamentous cyanobacterium CCP5]|nr:glycosyl hydrolase family 57 [filamentous cyanobacterium CCP5]